MTGAGFKGLVTLAVKSGDDRFLPLNAGKPAARDEDPSRRPRDEGRNQEPAAVEASLFPVIYTTPAE